MLELEVKEGDTVELHVYVGVRATEILGLVLMVDVRVAVSVRVVVVVIEHVIVADTVPDKAVVGVADEVGVQLMVKELPRVFEQVDVDEDEGVEEIVSEQLHVLLTVCVPVAVPEEVNVVLLVDVAENSCVRLLVPVRLPVCGAVEVTVCVGVIEDVEVGL